MNKSDSKVIEKINIKDWYNNPNIITNMAIIILSLIIILSQSYAVQNNLGADNILRSLLNHNSIYLLGLIYFIPLKTKIGKKYFNYFNLFLILIYAIFTITGVLTFIQSFGITSLITLCINVVILAYMIHTLLRDCRIWKDLKLEKSPLNDIHNINYFYAIIILAIVLLTINLIETLTVAGAVISLLGCGYSCIIARYIYLYRIHVESKNIKKKGE